MAPAMEVVGEERGDARAWATGATARDPLTDLLTKAGFLRLVDALRHDDAGPFAVARLRIDDASSDDALRAAADAVRRQLAPGDMAGRWGPNELVVLRHPALDDGVDDLAERLQRTVGGATVSVVRSTEDGDSPHALLVTRAPRATGSGARDAAARRRATPGEA